MEQKQAAITSESVVKGSAPGPKQQRLAADSTVLESPRLLLERLHATVGNHSTGRWLQKKLRVGPANDSYEQEADRVAERVTRMPDPLSSPSAPTPEKRPPATYLQREAYAEGIEAETQEEGLDDMGAATEVTGPFYRPDEPEADPQSSTGDLLQRKSATDVPLEEETLDGLEALSPQAGSGGVVQRSCSCDGSGEDCPECKGKDGTTLQRTATSETRTAEAPSIVGEVLRSPGEPLRRSTREFFEPRLGFDLSDVRVHTDSKAARSAKAVNALAYTVGRNVVFGSNQFSPGSEPGNRLLAHELTHVIQQSGGSKGLQRFESPTNRIVQRNVDGALVRTPLEVSGSDRWLQRKGNKEKKYRSIVDDPPDCQMTASLQGFAFSVDDSVEFAPGLMFPQLQAVELKKLVGGAYSKEFNDQFIAEFGLPLYVVSTGDDIKGPVAQGGEKLKGSFAATNAMRKMLRICAKLGKPATLSPEHQRFLDLAEAAAFAYRHMDHPKWFTKEIFLAVVANRAKLLSDLSEVLKRDPSPEGNLSPSKQKVMDLSESLKVSVTVVDEIRMDPKLVEHPVYQELWPTPVAKGGKKSAPAPAPEDRAPKQLPAAELIAYCDARPILSKQALRESEARKKMLDGYAAAASYRKLPAPGKGDQKLLDFPTEFTAPPYPATLSIYPTLQSSLYGSSRSEYGFSMALEFPNIFAGFQFHDYDFTAFRVPDDKLINAATAMKGGGRHSSHWDLLKSRLARDARYREADVRAYAGNLWDQIGPPGKTLDLINLNAGMRNLGTIIGTAFETVFDPSYTARFTFPDEGLYIVRCVAEWFPGVEVNVKRPPSVAYQPLFARDPELLAEMQLQEQVSEIEEAKKLLPKVIEKMGKTKDPKQLEDLKREREQLEAVAGGVEGLLKYQQSLFSKQVGKDAAERADKLQDILNTRKALGFDKNSERLPAVYVSDSGQVLDLLIEVRTLSEDAKSGTGEYLVHDATTPSGTQATRSGKKHDAIKAALQALFKDSDYGRGKASVLVDGVLEPIDVPTVSAGKLLMEAASNTATLLTIIAIAAAPFTGGASMALMVPAMVIGAVPSAYNIIHREIDHTLHFDLALTMDVVNIVGAALGVGAETRAGMQAIRLGTTGGKILIVTGLGVMGASVLMMTEGVLDQLEAVQNIPEGLRQAKIMEILGHFMFQAGIMVGQILVSQARARGEIPRTFDDWLAELDGPTRDRVLASKTEAQASRNFWKIYSEMDPLVRDLLTQCGSDCIPMDPPPSKEDQARIKKLAEVLSPRARRTLKGMLHDNRTPPAMDLVLKAIEEARDKAPRSKGGAKKAAAVEQAILARGTGADYILANFSEEPVEALDKANPGKWKRARQLADEIAKAGKLELDTVAKVLDNVRRIEGGDPEELLNLLKNLSDIAGKVDGVEKILGPDGLSGGYARFKGARWTLRFLNEAQWWDKVQSFEDPVPGALIDRVVDVRLRDGTRIEMKSWQSWHIFAGEGFARQIMADWLPTNGLRDPLIWAFEPGEGIGTAADIIKNMNESLDTALEQKVRGYDDAFAGRRVQAIKDKLAEIVRVGAK